MKKLLLVVIAVMFLSGVVMAQPMPPNNQFTHEYAKLDGNFGIDKVMDKDGNAVNYIVYKKDMVQKQKTDVDTMADAMLAVFK